MAYDVSFPQPSAAAASDGPAATPPSILARSLEAVTRMASPKAAAHRRREEREAALAEGRKALARLHPANRNSARLRSAHESPDLAPAARAIETLEAAVLGLDSIAEHLVQGLDLIDAARECSNDGARALLAERYDEVRTEIDRIARTAYGGRTNLLDGLGSGVEAPLDGRGRAHIVIPGADATAGPNGLALPPPETAFQENAEIAAISASLEAASDACAALAQRFELEAAVLAARIATGITAI